MSLERIEGLPLPNLRKLLDDAPVGRHIAQLHRNPKTLTTTVCSYIGTGLERGEGVLVVASADNKELYLHRLREMGVKPAESQKSGQLTIFDSQEMLSRFMKNGMPDWAMFRDAVGPMIQAMQAKKWKSTRVYGEMVSDLWRADHTGAAIRLEIYWNELARLYQFCLLCCYELGGLDKQSYASAHDTVGRTHSDLLPTAH